MKTRRAYIMSVVAIVVALPPSVATFLGEGGAQAMARPRPPQPPVVLQWTADVHNWPSGTWDGAVAAAGAHQEGGFSDWRLPTEAELLAALQDGSWGQDIGADPLGQFRHWTSRAQGMWAYAVRITLDAEGSPILSLSGQSDKYLKSSNFAGAKFVRQQ